MEKQTVRPAHIRRRHILARLLLSAAAVVILLPVVLTALYSFFSPGEIKAFMQTRGSFDAKSLMEIKLSPNMFSLSQYYKILIEDMTILRYFVNSAMYTAAILFGQALLIPAMAYALSRFRFRGRDALFFVVIMLMLLPFQVTMVPNVITLRAMGLLDTIWAIILPMTVAPFYIFLLRQYMVGLPGDMIEAAHGRAPAVATGVKRVLPGNVVFAYQGDGDLASIGMAETVHAATRGEHITVIFINNAIYGMTGGQMAPTSLPNQVTQTSPYGRDVSHCGYPVRVSEMLATLNGPAYIERVSVHDVPHIKKAKAAIKKAFQLQMEGRGFTLVEVLSTCPTNWGKTPKEAFEWLKSDMLPTYPLGVYKDITTEGGQA